MAAASEVLVWDETLRDGEQSPGVAFSIDDKIQIAMMLDDLGVDIIGAGFPATSSLEAKAVHEISRLGLNARIGVTCRASEQDLDQALSLGIDEVHVFFPTSDIHLAHKMGGLTRSDAMKRIDASISYARQLDLSVAFIAEDASRTNFEFLLDAFKCAEDGGAETVLYADTLGILTPDRCGREIAAVRGTLRPETNLGIHCHDDFGMATANTLVAASAGSNYVTATINGIGERAGNAATEEVVLALAYLYGRPTRIREKQIMCVSSEIARRSGMLRAANKAVVGYNMFRHESGIHTAALIKSLSTYEYIKPEDIGADRSFVIGKHAGRAHVRNFLTEHKVEFDEVSITELMSYVARRQELKPARPVNDDVDDRDDFCHEQIRGIPTSEILKVARELSPTEVNVT